MQSEADAEDRYTLTHRLLHDLADAEIGRAARARRRAINQGVPTKLVTLWAASVALKREAEYEEYEFAKRFNALMTALSDFASSYNADHTMNVKKVKAIERAWRKLEKSEWFRPPKGD